MDHGPFPVRTTLIVSTLTAGLALTACGTTHPAHTSAPSAAPSVTMSAIPTDTAPVATPPPLSPSVVRTRNQVVFTVTGYAPGGADITYGSDSDNRSPAGGLGFDGSGSALPWQGSIRYRPDALYYDVTAQLQGGGDITCKVRVRVTEWFTDGTHISRAKTVASGHASGGYNICDAQAENS